MKMEIQIKIKTEEGFCGLINWCRKEGSERNSEREKKERERDHRVRERETQASGQEVRKTRPKSRTALVANRNQFFVGPH
jgi:BRCT domain type II-containing protein